MIYIIPMAQTYFYDQWARAMQEPVEPIVFYPWWYNT